MITSVERRRRWSQDEKERLVAASLEPGATVSEVARVTGLQVSQLFRWRKELCKHSEMRPQRLGDFCSDLLSDISDSKIKCPGSVRG
ncbi:transposase [Bradyrhizobium sp. BRP22]|nr:transposase [Bradyrhizobium sp. BRP22]